MDIQIKHPIEKLAFFFFYPSFSSWFECRGGNTSKIGIKQSHKRGKKTKIALKINTN